jgi:cytoskeletal protein CcmA (bactofilin family)
VNQASVIGRGTVVRGSVRGTGSLEILGRVEGDVNVGGEIVLGDEAAVKGNVSGASVTISGAVQGDVRASESVMLERGARVVGDLTAPRVGISTGALVKGHVRTDGEPPLAGGRRTEAEPPLAGGRRAAGAGRPVAFSPRAQPVQSKGEAAPDSEESGDDPPSERAAPPPPVVPALAKGQKAKKKKKDG